MSARFVDEETVTHEAPKEEAPDTTLDSLSVVEDGTTENPDDSQAPAPTEEDPRYAGKTREEVIQMHQESMTLTGRHSKELGELRQIMDTYVQNQPAPVATKEETKEIAPEDFFEDPNKAVHDLVEQHPAVKEARETTEQMRQQAATAQLHQDHPDAKEILSDPKFMEYVQSSPIRQELYQRADQFDVVAAGELLSGFKSTREIATETVRLEEKAREQQLKAAQTGNTSGSGQAAPGRIFKRSEIRNLMIKDPDAYYRNIDEIQRAYAEGRVR